MENKRLTDVNKKGLTDVNKKGEKNMNRVILMGRLTRDVEVRIAGNGETKVANFSLAVDRRWKRDGEPNADFPNCIAFNKTAEFLEKYGKKGTKFVVEGRLQTGSYEKQDGTKVYTTDVVVDNVEFAESKTASENVKVETETSDVMNFDDADIDELPFGI